MAFEPVFAIISLGYALMKDGGGAIVRIFSGRTPSEKIALRQKWKPQFENEIVKNFREKVRSDIIIRDVKRVDSYPEVKEENGISPWFRLGLLDTYHKGILVGLRWTSLIELADGRWRARDSEKDETEGLKVILAGQIPFESIEAVDFDGDEYYGFPHIYCHFSFRREPYESMSYYVKRQNPGGRPYYIEIAGYKSVRKISRKLGIKNVYL